MQLLTVDFLEALGAEIGERLEKYWALQGHIMPNSKFVSEMEHVPSVEEKSLTGYSVHYARFVNQGVPANRIPFSGRSGRGGASKYIEGLRQYVERRMGLDGKEALSVAFAIAHKHKAEGMPTDASRRFSQTGERVEFLDKAFAEIEREGIIEKLANEYLPKAIEAEIEKHI